MKLDVMFRSDGLKAPRGQKFLFIAAAIQMVRRNDSDLDNFVIAARLRPPVAPSRAKQLPPAKVSADD